METKRLLRQFIHNNFYPGDNVVLADDTSLLDSGLIDSTGVLELIGFLESEFGISVEDMEVVPENLDTLERLAAFVASKTAASLREAQPA